MKKIIAITGGTGFIGNLLALKHASLNHEVRVLTRKKKSNHNGIYYVQADLKSKNISKELEEFVRDVDILYNCAGEIYNEDNMEQLHVFGMQRLIDLAKGNINCWVQLSSVGAYGDCRSGIISSNSPENPLGIYEITKTKSDKLLKNSDLNYVIIRPSIVFGSTMSNKSLLDLSNIIRKKLFFFIRKDSLLNYVHVDDLIKALMLCGENQKAIGKTYIISESISLKNMVGALCEGMNINPPKLSLPYSLIIFLVRLFGRYKWFPLSKSRLNALTNYCRYDSSQIKEELGFKFNLTLKESLKNYAKSIK